MRNLVLAAAVSALVAACAVPSSPAASSAPSASPRSVGEIPGLTWKSHTVVYQCQSGTKLQVAYLNMKSGESFAAIRAKQLALDDQG